MIILLISLFNCLVCSSYGHETTSIYRVIEENKILDIVPAIHEENTTSLTECFLTIRQHSSNFCFVQTEQIQDGVWRCSAFNKIVKSTFKTKSRKNSNIYILAKDQRKCLMDTASECSDWFRGGKRKDGVYQVRIGNIVRDVYCDMTRDHGGWTIIQRRFDGTVSFERTWQEYKDGFGDASGEYWLGNEMIHNLTKGTTTTKIRITGTSFSGEQKHIIAWGFWIEDETQKYKLHTGTQTYGDESLFESFHYSDGSMFTTEDNENDMRPHSNCASIIKAGWWYNDCQRLNTNGPYPQTEDLENGKFGLMWYKWIGIKKSLKSFELAIRKND